MVQKKTVTYLVIEEVFIKHRSALRCSGGHVVMVLSCPIHCGAERHKEKKLSDTEGTVEETKHRMRQAGTGGLGTGSFRWGVWQSPPQGASAELLHNSELHQDQTRK